jgi:hypothetical protein
MRAFDFTAMVQPDHTLTVSLPADVSPGLHRVVVIIHDNVLPTTSGSGLANLPSIDAGLTDPANTFRREDMYGAAGR